MPWPAALTDFEKSAHCVKSTSPLHTTSECVSSPILRSLRAMFSKNLVDIVLFDALAFPVSESSCSSVSFDNASIRNAFLLDWILHFQEAMIRHSISFDLEYIKFLLSSMLEPRSSDSSTR